MEITWLGQAGYLLQTSKHTKIMIDPYLSNALEEAKGEVFRREIPICTDMAEMQIDILLLSHLHDDHTDLQSLDVLLAKEPIAVLAPPEVCRYLLPRYGNRHNFIFLCAGTEVSLRDMRVKAIPAYHSTEAIGFELHADARVIYHTGDTLYHSHILEEAPPHPDALLLPINGCGNNMNPEDAYRFFSAISPARVFPMHWDMFRKYGCDVHAFCSLLSEQEQSKVIIPRHYEAIPL